MGENLHSDDVTLAGQFPANERHGTMSPDSFMCFDTIVRPVGLGACGTLEMPTESPDGASEPDLSGDGTR